MLLLGPQYYTHAHQNPNWHISDAESFVDGSGSACQDLPRVWCRMCLMYVMGNGWPQENIASKDMHKNHIKIHMPLKITRAHVFLAKLSRYFLYTKVDRILFTFMPTQIFPVMRNVSISNGPHVWSQLIVARQPPNSPSKCLMKKPLSPKKIDSLAAMFSMYPG